MSVDGRRLMANFSIAKRAIVVVLGLCGFASQSAADAIRLAQQAAPQAKQQAQAPIVRPSARQIVLLTRSALMTLGDAMRTGNYTVLHDVGAPSFRKANPPERLAQIFSNLVARRVDLTLAAITVPRMDEALVDEKARLLRLKGSFPTRPSQINFVLLFQEVGGHWRLFGISVDTSEVRAAPGPASGAAPANVAGGAGRAGQPPKPNQSPGAAPANVAAGAGPANQPPLPKRNPGGRGWSTGVAPANAAAAAAPVSKPAPSTGNSDTVRPSSSRARRAPKENEDWGQ